MTLKNRDVFVKDPTTTTIPNDGVAQVKDPSTPQEWEILRYELSSFVCEGEYRAGLERVLSTYLAHLDKPTQPAVWVSGFYGSGKSHFVRVLEYLWRDIQFPDGVSARALAHLPQDIQDHLLELSTAGKREGGLWSAAGILGAGKGNSIRLSLLAILFRAAGLPEQYATARFVVWLKQNGYYDGTRAAMAQAGKDFDRDLPNLYVSPYIAQALLAAYPDFAPTPADARGLLRTQFPPRDDISDDEMLTAISDVLELQSTTPGRLPCALIVFDELQQFIGDDGQRTLDVQHVVEACSTHFGSRILFVATGQSALQATTQLSKLQGRFTVRVTLSDTDVERVVREVVLRKKPDQIPALKAALDSARGEIDRELAGAKIGPTQADTPDLVPDYPLLPARRRFWEHVLRAVDSAGTAGQLRTQLRVVHEAAREVADAPLGTVVAGDMIYSQLTPDMLQNGVLLRDVYKTIQDLANDNTTDGRLKARLCATAFLIGRLPTEGLAVTGLRATATTLADLLIEDISTGSDPLRQRIPVLLDQLVDASILMRVSDEYRLQTRESAEWEQDYRQRNLRIASDEARLASDRASALRTAIAAELKSVSLTQGRSKVPRKFDLTFAADAPTTDTTSVQAWARDGWSASEKTVRDDAQVAGVESPIVYVFTPRHSPDELARALASVATADETLKSRPVQTTQEGIEARSAMMSRRDIARAQLDSLIAGAIRNTRVFLGGGAEISQGSLAASIRSAIESALARLFPSFDIADDPRWAKVAERAGQGAADALTALDYPGDVENYPVCSAVRTYIGGSGKRGGDIQKHFAAPPYGWTRDAIDGALLALVASGHLRASRNGQPVTAKQTQQNQIGVTDFASEGAPLSATQRIEMRGLLASLGFPVKPGEESEAAPEALRRLTELAASAGGDAPLPARPATSLLDELKAKAGNEQFVAMLSHATQLKADYTAWTTARKKITERQPRWTRLHDFIALAQGLPIATTITTQTDAITANRALLDDPDPVAPLLTQLTSALRQALQDARARYDEVYQRSLTTLEATDEWKKLPAADSQRILKESGVGYETTPNVSTDEALLDTLRGTPISTWDERAIALTARLERARALAAKQLEPQAVTLKPRPATLKSGDEVDRYLADLREEIMANIKAGHPVIL